MGNAFESVTSIACWTTNPFRTLGQTILLFVLCGLIREVIKSGFGFVADKGLAGSEEVLRDGWTAFETIRLQAQKQAKANMRDQEQQPQDPKDNKTPD